MRSFKYGNYCDRYEGSDYAEQNESRVLRVDGMLSRREIVHRSHRNVNYRRHTIVAYRSRFRVREIQFIITDHSRLLNPDCRRIISALCIKTTRHKHAHSLIAPKWFLSDLENQKPNIIDVPPFAIPRRQRIAV